MAILKCNFKVNIVFSCTADSLSHWLLDLLSVMHTISALQSQQFLLYFGRRPY